MQHLDEGTIHAWLDGELPVAEREAAEAHVTACEQCGAAVAEARGFIAASSRILLALDAVPGGVLPQVAQSPRAAPPSAASPFALPRRVPSRAWMAAAAVLVLGTATAIVIRPRRSEPLAKVAMQDQLRAPAVAAPVESAPASAEPAKTSAAAVPGTSVAIAPAPAPTLADAKVSRAASLRKDARSTEMDKPATVVAEGGATGAAASPPVAKESAPASPRGQVQLDQVIISGAGVATNNEKLGAVNASNEAPLMVSQNSAVEGADTIVTTVYIVNRRSVQLVDRPSGHEEEHRAAAPGFSDTVTAKARDSTAMNSITWSDSAGRTRTLRGPMSQSELERVKLALFGPTP